MVLIIVTYYRHNTHLLNIKLIKVYIFYYPLIKNILVKPQLVFRYEKPFYTRIIILSMIRVEFVH